MRAGSIPWQEAVNLLIPIARALDYAHRQEMIHRDVKPSNILITEDGEPMLTDFGVAKIIDEEATVDLTGTSMAVGTPEYMAPEQFQGKVDFRIDIYALGVVLYEMVTGRKPYTADTPAALIIKQVTDPLPRPKRFMPNLPDDVEKLLLKTLSRQPEDRYQTMGELVVALGKLARGDQDQAVPKKTMPEQRRETEKAPPKSREAVFEVFQSTPKWMWWTVLGIGGILGIVGILAIELMIGMSNWIGTRSIVESISETATPEQDVVPSLNRPVDDMVVMFIPAGEFSMGSDNGDSDERPAHTVYLDAFRIDQTEVTNKMYLMCVDAGECGDPGVTIRSSAETNPNYPVNVSWNMATAYCTWAGARLPTEAEWEKAARGGLQGDEYPWGDERPSCQAGASNGAQFKNCSGEALEVKTFAPNGFGLYDMSGNAWEWVADLYDPNYYKSAPAQNPKGPLNGQYHVIRGGSWLNDISYLRSAVRAWMMPYYSSAGFRCARDATP